MSASLEFEKTCPCIRKIGVMLMCPYEFDVALCSITVKNVALSFLLVDRRCSTLYCRIISPWISTESRT